MSPGGVPTVRRWLCWLINHAADVDVRRWWAHESAVTSQRYVTPAPKRAVPQHKTDSTAWLGKPELRSARQVAGKPWGSPPTSTP
jgi:hypothetical protein